MAKKAAKRAGRAEAAAARAPPAEEEEEDAEPAPARKRPRTAAPAAAAAVPAASEPAEAGGAPAEAAAPAPGLAAAGAPPAWKNKEKPLVLCSRGIPGRYRHLMLDLVALLPHCKKDVKLDTKDERAVINEVAELQGCSSALFFEARKRKDLYLWVGATPDGPTVKFEVTNVHTMAELKLAGNHLKGSRPLVQFDAAFDGSPQGRLIRELLTHTFVVPKGCRKAKPFVDHVLAFFWLDGRVWVRNYQAVWPEGADTAQPHQKGAAPPELVEVGPRCVLHPIKVFAGSFRGAVLWGNAGYVSPNAVRRHARARQGGAYQRKVKAKERRKEHTGKWKGKADEFANERMFA